MRESEFRGKRIDNGEWVYGNLMQFEDSGTFIVGDTLVLQEFDNGEYTGREYWEDVVYITDYLQKEGIVVMGTLPNEREYPF